MNPSQRLKALMRVIIDETEGNPSFAAKVEQALSGRREASVPRDRPHRRPRGIVDPFELYDRGELELRAKLAELNIDMLRDIVAEHGMDSSQLARKWKTPDRLIELIVETVRSRAHKGDAFRSSPG